MFAITNYSMNIINNNISTFYLPIDSRILLFNNTEVKIQDLKEKADLFSFDTEDKKLSPARVLSVEYAGKDNFYPIMKDTWIRADQKIFSKQKNDIREFNTLCNPRVNFYESKTYDQNIINISDQYAYILGYLRGFWDGDGYLKSFNNGVTTYASFCQNKRDVLEEIQKLMEQTLNIECGFIKELSRSTMYEFKIRHTANSRKFVEISDFSLNKRNKDYLLGYLNGNIIAEGNMTYNKASKMLFCGACQSLLKNTDIINNIDYCLSSLKIYCNIYNSHKIDNQYTIKNWKFSRPYRLPFIYGASKKSSMINKFHGTYNLCSIPYLRINKFNLINCKEFHYYKLTTKGKGNTIFNNRLLLIGN